jgi:hypothetical protein
VAYVAVCSQINPKHLKTQSYRAVNTFNLGYKNQPVYAVSGTIRCLFSDNTKRLKTSPYRAVNTFNLGYTIQPVYPIICTSRGLFSDKYKTFKDPLRTAL